MNPKNLLPISVITITMFAQSNAVNSRIPQKDIPRIYSVIKALQNKKYPNNPMVGTAKAEHLRQGGASITEKWTIFDHESKAYAYKVEYIEMHQRDRDIKISYFNDSDRATP